MTYPPTGATQPGAIDLWHPPLGIFPNRSIVQVRGYTGKYPCDRCRTFYIG